MANSCRPKRIREKPRGGPANQCVSAIGGPGGNSENGPGVRTPGGPRPREPGRACQRDVSPRYRAPGTEGGPLARALGSALNGHKWQTNTAVGSASTKVETSRATTSFPGTRFFLPPTFAGPPGIFLIVLRGLHLDSSVADLAIVGTTLLIRE